MSTMRAGLGVGLALMIENYTMSTHRWIGVSVVAAVSAQVGADSAAAAHPPLACLCSWLRPPYCLPSRLP